MRKGHTKAPFERVGQGIHLWSSLPWPYYTFEKVHNLRIRECNMWLDFFIVVMLIVMYIMAGRKAK